MNVFIFEYYASGLGKDFSELKSAGFAMLDAVVKDFVRIPDLEVITLLDSSFQNKIANTNYGKSLRIYWVEEGITKIEQYIKILDLCNAVLIIAPETESLIEELTRIAEGKNKMILGSSSQALRYTCNKAHTLHLMQSKGIPAPKSKCIRKPLSMNDMRMINYSYPLVIKPVHGTGGEGVKLVRDHSDLRKVLAEIISTTCQETHFMVQEYIPGPAVSVSLLIYEGRAVPLSLNQQLINQETELFCQGVMVPYHHPLAKEIIEMAVTACKQIPGLKGFIGVDLVVNSQGPVLMEINSRITLAYVALREVVCRNLAWDLWVLCQEHRLPDKPRIRGTFTYHL